MEQRIKGTTGLMALIGSPVGHSGSPAMYNFSFRHHNLDYAYMAFDIKEDQVPAALDAIRLFKMRGANVTMPCKNEVAKHMDELSPAARIIGAVNTIVNEDGKLVGHITDGIGFVRNLKEHGVDVKGKKMVVLGAGGAATAIQVQCALDGAESISIFNPKDPFFARAESTAEKLSKETPDSCLTSVIWNWSAYYTSAVKSIINGTWDGSNYYGGMAEGLVGITNLASFVADGTQEKVDEATASILRGQNNVFDGVLKTNTGETIGAENQTLDDATITGGINWYYHNVNIVE